MSNKSFKGILLVLSLVVVFMFLIQYFLYNQIKNKSEHIDSIVSNLSMQAQRQQYIFSTDQILSSFNGDIGNINNSVIKNDGDVKFIEDLDTLAVDNGLEINIDSLNFEEIPKVASSTVVFFKIRAKTHGSWAATYKFLAELESLPFKIKISKFSMINAPATATADSTEVKSGNEWQSNFEMSALKYK
jgi:hypothetical protein